MSKVCSIYTENDFTSGPRTACLLCRALDCLPFEYAARINLRQHIQTYIEMVCHIPNFLPNGFICMRFSRRYYPSKFAYERAQENGYFVCQRSCCRCLLPRCCCCRHAHAILTRIEMAKSVVVIAAVVVIVVCAVNDGER